MKKQFTYLCAIALCSGAVLFNACTKTGPTGPAGSNGNQGPAGPSYTGTISGHIDLYDQYGSQLLNSKTARAILYNGSNVMIDSVNADSSGKYSFSNISTGMYTIAYRDSAYGQQLKQNFQFLGGGTLNVDGKISKIPNFNITAITADSVNHATMNAVISCNIATDTKVRTLLIFASNSPSTSSNPANYLVIASQNVKANSTTVVINIPLSNLYNAGMVSTSTVYFAIYGAASNYNTASSYEDYATGRTIFTAITSTAYSPLASVVLP